MRCFNKNYMYLFYNRMVWNWNYVWKKKKKIEVKIDKRISIFAKMVEEWKYIINECFFCNRIQMLIGKYSIQDSTSLHWPPVPQSTLHAILTRDTTWDTMKPLSISSSHCLSSHTTPANSLIVLKQKTASTEKYQTNIMSWTAIS